MNWLPTAAEWTATWTLLLAVTAAIALVVAWFQLKEIRRQRRDTNRAYVLVYSDADPGESTAFYIVVENAGKTHARDVSIEFSEPIRRAVDAGPDINSPELWNVSLLPPGYSYRTVFDFGHKRVKTDLPYHYEATVRWKSPATDGDEILDETYGVDFSRFKAMTDVKRQG